MSGRPAHAVALAGLLAAALAGCESTQAQSARLAKQGAEAAVVGTVSAGARNPDVRVGRTTLLRSALGTAAVVELTNTGPADQAAVPIQLDVEDAKGASVYKNDTDGLQPSLQQLALLRRGRPVFWVNDQVTAAAPARKASVTVGRARGPAPADVPEIRLVGTRMDEDESGPLATGIVENRSRVTQRDMPIYGVVRRGGKVVAAGRALVEKLPPGPRKKPVRFSIFFIGDPSRGTLDVRAVPTVLTGRG